MRLWDGALLVVSHDRYFLDNVVNRIWEMSRTSLEVYRGNYSAYVQQRQERWERQAELYEAERERLEKELEFIRRNIAGQNTDIAKGKLKRLSRELWALDELGLMGVQGKSWSEISGLLSHGAREMNVAEAAEHIRAFRPPQTRPPRLTIRLGKVRRSGDLVLRTKGLKVGYPANPLFQADDIILQRGESAALIGPNGSGKTTFLRTVLGDLPPLAGEVQLGVGLHVGYFAQAHDALNLQNTVIQELLRHRPGMSEGEARNHLAQYLFREDDVWKQVSALSGGERGKLALAILALQGANFLLLDEPTNHLDIAAQEILQEVLEVFEGTTLLVSHDRYLVNRLATQIWEVRDQHLTLFPGTYQELLAAREQSKQAARTAAHAERAATAPAPTERVGLSKEERRRRKARLDEVEATIHALETQVTQCEAALQDATEAQRLDDIQRFSERYLRAQAELDGLLAEWGQLAEALA